MEKIHKDILVKGKVQGVSFRASARHTANDLGITGEVRNLPDGSVFISAEGEEQQMESFIAWCRQGPALAKVTELVITVAPVQHYKSFEIVR
ncbi:acylphosphatase [Chitinophaga rhizophila]|uniref:acylphosphatase n=1 Tax=Chitinophaga rhizophila TaxID=2866212 RepID=A0ABS7GAZ2_9BACT|nr:acylphosphatase [Chitinophaga rhizophila]MBW8684835.1 acylphosphatase [Chitinophaga rhizophila]